MRRLGVSGNAQPLDDGRMARLAAELLAQLSFGDAKCAARYGHWPALAGFFPDYSVRPIPLKTLGALVN